jgi:hypothetical protein
MATAGSIVIDLLMRTGSFVTDSERAEKAVKKLQKAAKEMGAVLGAGLATAATSLTMLVKSSIDTMDEMSKTAKVLNMGTEDFSKLAYAASFADLSVQDLQTTIGRLTKAQAEALDPSSKDANGKLRPTIDLLYDFADAYKAQKGSQEVVAAGMSIFGKSFQSLIDLLKDGSQGLRDAGAEAEAFGQVVSGTAGTNAEEFNDNLARMKIFVQGVGNAVAADLLPDLLSMSGQFLDGAQKGEKLNEVAGKIADGLRVIGTGASYVAKAFEVAGTAIAATLATAHGGLLVLQGEFKQGFEMFGMGQQGLIDSFRGGSGGSKQAAAQPADATGMAAEAMSFLKGVQGQADAEKRAKATEDALRKLLAGGEGGSGGGKAGGGQKGQADELARAYERINAQLDEQIALHGKAGAAAKLDYDLTAGALKGLSDAEKESLRQKQATMDLLDQREAADERVRKELEEQREAEEDRKKAFKDQKADLEFELSILSLTNKERAKAIELRYLGAEATEEERKAIGLLSDSLYDQSKAMGDLVGLQDQMRGAFADNFYDLVKGAASAKDAVTDFFDSVASNILKMIANNFAASLFGEQGQNGGGLLGGLMSKMFSGMSGGGGGASGGGFLSTLMSGAASLFGGAKATGGDVLSGRGYWVGEEGPEWFAPRGTGTIVPTAAAMASARGSRQVVQNLNVTVAGKPDRRTPMQIAREVGRESSRAMARNGR